MYNRPTTQRVREDSRYEDTADQPCISLQHNSCLCSYLLLYRMNTHNVCAAANFTGKTRWRKGAKENNQTTVLGQN